VILFSLAWCGYDRWQAEAEYYVQSAIPGQPSKWDDHLFALDREALQEAYRDQLRHLFSVAMKSPDAQSFGRAKVGAENARKAYIAVMEAIEAREKEDRK
jgi:hypothetical protein